MYAPALSQISPDTLEIDRAGIGACARNDQFGFAFERQLFHLVVVDRFRFGRNAVGNDLEIFAGNIDGEPCVRCPPCERFMPMMVSPGSNMAK